MLFLRGLLATTLLALAFTAAAASEPRGWLRYADGNAVSGTLIGIDADGTGGRFRSDRFGEIRFRADDASFEADDPAVAEGPAEAPSPWFPTRWSIALSGYWEDSDGTTTSDAAVDVDATWRTTRDELDLAITTDFKMVDGAVDNNEQTVRGRWFHDLTPTWFVAGLAKARRTSLSLNDQPAVDALLLEGSLALGARHAWSPDSRTRLALGHDRVAVEILKYDAIVRTHATSLLFENNLQLSPRVAFNNTYYGYLWEDGSWGTDSKAEALYAVSSALSVGLRHEYRRNAVNFDVGTYRKLSLTTRVSF